MRGKKAQFYILMAAIISFILIGLIAIVNYASVKPEPIKFYDLSKQLEREAGRVIDYSTYTGTDAAQNLENYVQNFLAYAHESDPDIGVIYIYANLTYLVVANYGKNATGVITTLNKTELSGGAAQQISTIGMYIGNQQIGQKIAEEKRFFSNIKFESGPAKNVTVNMSNVIYQFELKGAQTFFAIVKSEKENETYYYLTS